MSQPPEPVEVFCSYAHKDEPQLQKLEAHLSLLKHQGLISTWHDRHIVPGMNWDHSINTHLNSASVILLLISSDFLASDYCSGIEMQRAMERHEANEARVIPILLRPVDWQSAPFGLLQALPTNAKPITTWSNRDEAWADVVAGIRRTIEDLPRLAVSTPRTALPPVWSIPYPRNSVFTGREELLEQLAKSLRIEQTMALTQPQAMSGLGGIGKTQLAVEYAYQYHFDYQAVLWALAENRGALISAFVAIAGLLNLPEKDAQEQLIAVNAVKVWMKTHTQWLLILDNADDLAIIPEFLPPTSGGHILLTTRAQAMGRLAQRIEVDTLTPDVGALFLLRRAGLLAPDASPEQASPHDRDMAKQIAEELGGLPLALDQAGAYIEETGCGLANYQQLYQHRRAELLKERRGLIADHPESVATTVFFAARRVEQNNPAAAELLRLCAFLAPDAIPEEIIAQGAAHLGPLLEPIAADAFLLNQAIEALRASSLVQRDPGRKTLSIHRLVQAVLRDAMGAEEAELWTERAVRAVNAASPPDLREYRAWLQMKRLLIQAQHCAALIMQWDMTFPEGAHLLDQAGYFLCLRHRYSEAEPLLQRALAIREQSLPPTPLDIATSLNHLAQLYEGQEKYAEAEPLFRRALALREQLLPLHDETVNHITRLARFYLDRGKYAEAEPLFRHALAIREQQDHPAKGLSYYNLAAFYNAQGKHNEAERLLKHVLMLTEQQFGEVHTETAGSLSFLASLYQQQGKYIEAEPLFQRVLAIYKQVSGDRHPAVASGLSSLASLYREQGRYIEAEPLFQRALAIWEQVDPTHPTTARHLSELAWLYTTESKYTQAEPLFQRALAIYEQQLGDQHADTMAVRRSYASLLREMGRETEAIKIEAQTTPL